MSQDWAKDKTYSEWHRPASLVRFLTPRIATELKMLDLDNPPISNIYTCRFCWLPVAIAEDTSRDLDDKPAHLTRNVADKLGVDGYLIRWWPSDERNPAQKAVSDIEKFEVRRLVLDETLFHTPQEHANWLFKIQMQHLVLCPSYAEGRYEPDKGWVERQYIDALERDMYEKVGS